MVDIVKLSPNLDLTEKVQQISIYNILTFFAEKSMTKINGNAKVASNGFLMYVFSKMEFLRNPS